MFWEGVWSAAHELAPLGVNVLTLSQLSGGCGEQAQVLRDLFVKRVDAVVLLPGDSKKLNGLIDQHALRNTPVVTVLHDAPESRRTAFVGSDYRLSGRLAGDLMAKMLRPKSHIVALTGTREALHLKERYEGFRDALEASKIPLGLTTFDDADHFATVIAGRGRKFDGLYIGCSEAVDTRPLLDQVRTPARCVTFDLTEPVKPYLEKRVVSAVIDSSRYYQGYLAVQKAFECLQTFSVAPSWVPIPSTVVLPEHVTSLGEQSSLHSIFETLVRQRTAQLRTYKQALDLANAKLQRMAETDPLTGLLNRRKFEEVLDLEVERSHEGEPLSIMVAQVDHFTSLNDLLGGPAAEQAVKLIADTIRSSCRGKDILARLGPDQLAICLPGTGTDGVLLMRERIEAAVEEVRSAAHSEIRLSVSVGVTTLFGPSRNASQIIEQASANSKRRRQSRAALIKLPRTG